VIRSWGPETFSQHRGKIAPAIRGAAILLAVAGCSATQVPNAQSIAGQTPSGSVTLTETFAAGYGGGSGTLAFNGQNYPFRLFGAVIGPGGADRINASGAVYNLSKLSDFSGRYTQGSGPAGLSRSGPGDLWLQNSAGIVMHLESESTGVLLSLGKEEIVIRLEQGGA